MSNVRQIDGHTMRVERTESGRRFRLLCSCGFGQARWLGDTPPTKATEREAIRQGIWHLQDVEKRTAARERVNGLSTRSTHPSARIRHSA